MNYLKKKTNYMNYINIQVKEMKEKAMSSLSQYLITEDADQGVRSDDGIPETSRRNYQPFVSLLELVSEIYKVEFVSDFLLSLKLFCFLIFLHFQFFSFLYV